MGLTLITPAASYPVTATEAKAHCRVDTSDEDTYIDSLIAAATDYVEAYLARAIMAQTYKLTLDKFSDTIFLPKGPVQSVTTVNYNDTNGDEQTLATGYTFDGTSDPQRIVRDSGASWPQLEDAVSAVNITYVSGYATTPPAIQHAILLLIGQWFDAREDVSDRQGYSMPNSVEALLSNFRSFSF